MKLVQHYLCISRTSVSAEQLFPAAAQMLATMSNAQVTIIVYKLDCDWPVVEETYVTVNQLYHGK